MAEKPSITILWPGLAPTMQEINQSLLPAALKKTLSKARFTPGNNTFEYELLALFSKVPLMGRDLPVAKLRQPGQLSLCADPCYLHADRDRLLLFPVNDLTMEEGQHLIGSLQPLFDAFDAQLVPNDLNHWSLWLEKMPDISLTAMSSLIGKSVVSALPAGPERQQWLRLTNEVQMQLFEHPVNQQRQMDGKIPVNSLWFWGIDEEWQPESNVWQQLYGDARLLKMLAEVTATARQPITKWQTERLCSGNQLLVLPELDLERDWSQTIEQFTTQTLLPLLKKLRHFQVRQLRLIIPEHGHYRWRTLDVWKPWS